MPPELRCRLVRLLTEAGADVCAKDHIYQQTPLHAVFRHFHSNPEELIGLTQVLAEAGTPLTEPDGMGKTPLDYLKLYARDIKQADWDKLMEILKKNLR